MKPRTGQGALDALLYAAHRVRTAVDTALREDGLSLPRFKLLQLLNLADRSMREASDELHVSPRTVTDIIDGLQDAGLVVRGAHPSDRRITLLAITDAGRSRLVEATRRADHAHELAIRELDQGERQTLCGLLDKVAPKTSATSAAGNGAM